MNSRSRVILQSNTINRRSKLINAIEAGINGLESYEDIPNGIFGSTATIKTNNVTLKSEELDFEFTVPFDDDLEPNQADITIYNLSTNTINNIEKKSKITIEAGYKNDTGIIFEGIIKDVTTGWEDVDRVTRIIAYSCDGLETVESITYSENTKASKILKDLIEKLKVPVAVFEPKRDWTYTDSVTIEGNLREEIKKYAEVCGISVYSNNGSIYARHIKDGDNINFTVNENTGLIGSPEHYTEEINAEDYIDEIDGYKCEMLLQHRITTAAIVNLSSREVNGVFRIRKGEHSYSDGEATTSFEAIGNITTRIEEKEESKSSKTTSSKAQKVINTGKKYLGVPYKWGGNSSSGMDCSHFVYRCFKESGVECKLTSYATAQGIYNISKKISSSDRQVGDIVFFNNSSTNHIGIYTGNNKMLHCYSSGGVGITSVSTGGNLVGYGRLW